MKNKINVLDDLTINKIAAGEVVERPSSVVKELIENSIDANSSKVTIEIVDGGKKLIRITDDGIGILSSEVDKSFLRHATSKIKRLEDLDNLYSLGFRGEALASISSVSKLEMITKTKDEPIGTKVVLEGGKVILKEPIGCVNGTTLIISDIFFNTPARQKFLKSTHAETINISDLINKLAIGNPKIQFKYINNNKPMLNTPGDGKLINVIRSVYGKDVTENLVEIDFKNNHFELSGYIGTNNVYRANKNLQHIYINNRFVKSKVILDAISESYKSIIPINKHAVCFLNLKVNPSTIDVNIHPNKMEIKFESEKEIYVELKDYLKGKLLQSNLVGIYKNYDDKYVNKKENQLYNTENNPENNPDNKEDNKIEDNKIEVVTVPKDEDLNSFKSVSEVLESINKKSERMLDTKLSVDNINKESLKILDNISKDLDNTVSYKEDDNNSEDIVEDEGIQEGFFEDTSFEKEKTLQKSTKFTLSGYNVIGVVFNTYIILCKEDSMYLLDQHAAHERVLYEKYMNKFYSRDIDIQMLIDPIVMELSSVDILQVEKHLDLFLKFGFEIEMFGNNHIVIRSVPNIFGLPESEKFILQIIDNIEDINNNYELKGEKFASMACRSAIKANDKIYNIEIDKLLSQIEECENPFTCPHGRPIMVEISKNEIEKMFKRIM